MLNLLSMVEAKLPPGFRFHPRDEELVCDYLMKKVMGMTENSQAFPLLMEVDLNSCEPWDLPVWGALQGLWGALQGLQLAWDMGFRQIILELDNKSVVELLNGEKIPLNQHRHIVSLIRQLLQRRWFIRIVHIHREGNRAADWLASYAAHHAMGSHILEHCPSALSRILREDVLGVSFPRFCQL